MQMKTNHKKTKGTIDSHVQMPKSILRKFETNHHYYYYDVVKDIIGNRGTANTTNTEPGYYSYQMEYMLNQKIESPFLNVANRIINALEKEAPFDIDTKQIGYIFSYFYALIARSPKLFSIATKKMIYTQFANIPTQLLHDTIVSNAIGIGYNQEYEKNYFISFLVNGSSLPLVLPVRGMYTVLAKNHPLIIMPIHPSYAILLVHNDLQSEFIQDNQNHLMYTDNPKIIFNFNLRAFKDQCSDKWGYVVSADKDLLIKLRRPQ